MWNYCYVHCELWIKFPGIADGSTNIFITSEIPECCSECDDSMHNWYENVVTLYLKIGQENEYLRNCLSTKVSYVYLHPYCQRQIALHSFWETTYPICSIWHSSPKCSGTLVGWSWHEFYRDECLYRTDKDSGRWFGYWPQRHELENHLKKWQQCIPYGSSSTSIFQLGYPLKHLSDAPPSHPLYRKRGWIHTIDDPSITSHSVRCGANETQSK